MGLDPNQMSEKSWKDHLLSSGVPLEHTVEQVLKRIGFLNPREHKYVRADELGVPTVFSVDVHAERIRHDRDLWLELLIECKYRHPGKRWVFAPESYEEIWGPAFQDAFVFLDQTSVPRQFATGVLDKFAENYPLCKRGVELLQDGKQNEKSIRQAVEQVRFGVVDRVAEALKFQIGNRQRNAPANPLYVIVPIIVTTAELWRLRDDVTIETIQQANELSDVADPRDVLVYREPPDNLAVRHTVERIEQELTEEERGAFDLLLRTIGWEGGYKFFIDYFPANSPAQFVVIRQPRFEEAMKNLVKFVDRSDFIVPRERPEPPR